MKIEGTRAAVTGAATGIGRGIALALAEKGAAFVAIADLDLEAAERTAAEVRARGAKAISARVDVRHRAELEKFADLGWAQAGGIDLLFNNAGVARVARAFDISDADIEWLIQVNLMGVIHGTRVFGQTHAGSTYQGLDLQHRIRGRRTRRIASTSRPIRRRNMVSSAIRMRCAPITAASLA